MKVKLSMIDPQLRLAGFGLRLLAPRSERGFFRYVKGSNKLARGFLRGRNMRGLDCGELWIDRPDSSGSLRLRTYKRKSVDGSASRMPGPAVLWLHGGGYAMGIPEVSDRAIRSMLETVDCTVIAPDYRLSIEAPYPAAIDDCYAALLWLRDQAEALGCRSDQLFVGGESAGGGLAAALCLMARDKGEAAVAFQMPLYPMLDDLSATDSALDNDGPGWNVNMNGWAWKQYLGAKSGQKTSPYAAPARAENLKGLPPAVTFVGTIEAFRDETLSYVQRLREAGVEVEFRTFEGCFHGFDMLCPKAAVSGEAKAFFREAFKHAAEQCFASQKKL